jgi:hypothetical protein
VFTLQIHKGKLVSWWLSPDFRCAEGQTEVGVFNWSEPELRFQTYFRLRCPRTLKITVLHHSSKKGSIENDDEERRIEDGTRLERVEFTYDTHKDWTKRLVQVWDAKSDKMIPARENERHITYYDEEKTRVARCWKAACWE